MRARDVRRIHRFGARREIASIGLDGGGWRDAYHTLLTLSWPRFFALLLVAYLGVNGAFAASYLALGDGIENARPGSFADCFFFSVQTLATIGYGKMVPRSLGANVLVSAEALLGMVGLTVTTGLVFARFARPTARVLFSQKAVVRSWEGVTALMFRMANARGSQIAEARLKVALVRDERTADGESVRRVHDLELHRSESPFFALTWTVVHPIGPESPLHGATPASLRATSADIVVSLTGLDVGLAQTVHARHAFAADDLVFDAKLADIFGTAPDGTQVIDYRRFHLVEPLGPEAESPSRPRAVP